MAGDSDDLAQARTLAATGDRDVSLYGESLGAGAQVGAYVVEAYASRGGFATVYRARRLRGADGPLALKVLHPMLVSSPSVLVRFEREIKTLHAIRHPSIVEIIDHGTLPDGRPFYVMPWLSGDPLDVVLRERGAFSPAEAGAIIRELTDALAVAHAAGIVHRDIKPSNVFILLGSEPLELRLLDFGIAKVVSDETSGRHDVTSTGNRIGTPHYMAPEQITAGAVDARTDIYALGVLLFQLVTGQLPFTAPTPLEIESKHLYSPPPRASDYAPVPPAMDEVIARCLAKSPGDRFAGVARLAEAVEESLEAGSALTVMPTRSEEMVGVHVELILGLDDDDDDGEDAFDLLESIYDQALETCESAGFEIAVSGGTSFLAVAPLAVDRRASAMATALEIAALGRGAVTMQITVHQASTSRQPDGRFAGGDLLRLAGWIGSGAGVWATPEGLKGIERMCELGEPDAAGRRQVTSISWA